MRRCFTETSWSTLTKPRELILDLGLMGKNTISRPQLLAECTHIEGGRRPPVTPAIFEQEVETKSFTNGKDDKPLVVRLYKDAFSQQFKLATELDFSQLGWGDADVAATCGALQSAGELPKLRALKLWGNMLSAPSGLAVAQLVIQGLTPLLAEVMLNNTKAVKNPVQQLTGALPTTQLKLSGMDAMDGVFNAALLEHYTAPMLTSLNIESSDEAAALAIMRAVGSHGEMTSLRLTGCMISDDSAEQIGAYVESAALTYMDISRSSLSYKGYYDIGASLLGSTTNKLGALKCDVFDVPPAAHSINLTRKDIGESGATPLLASLVKSSTVILRLILSSNLLGDDGAIVVSKGLKNNSTLQELDLYNNGIGVAGARAIASVLSSTTLKRIVLSRNSLKDEGASAIGKSLKTNSTLETLELTQCSIGPTGGQAIGDNLKAGISVLKSLDLQQNFVGRAWGREQQFDGEQAVRNAVAGRDGFMLLL